jgi:hypothetical protein
MEKNRVLLEKVAASLRLPLPLLRQWRRRKLISVKAIDAGWHLIINAEPAATIISKAARRPHRHE